MKILFGSTMMRLASLVILAVTLGRAQSALAAAEADDAATIALGHRWCDAFYRGDLAPFWQQFDDKLRAQFGNLDALAAFRAQLLAQLGSERAIDSETVEHKPEGRIYVRIARFTNVPMAVRIQLAFVGGDRIPGFGIVPEAPDAPAPSSRLDYRAKTKLRLPFDGTWGVAWGGRTLADNYHAADRAQRFAYDFLVAKGEATHTPSSRPAPAASSSLAMASPRTSRAR